MVQLSPTDEVNRFFVQKLVRCFFAGARMSENDKRKVPPYFSSRLLNLSLALLCMAWFNQAVAGVEGTYVFAQSTVTYANLSGATLLGSCASGCTNSDYTVSLPFNFNFAGTTYTSGTNINVSTDGFLFFGSGPAASEVSPISTSTTATGIISPFGGTSALKGEGYTTTALHYLTSGTSPNQTLSIEWQCWGTGSGSSGNAMDFTVILSQTSNNIVFEYHVPGSYPVNSTMTAQVGIATSTSDFINLTTSSNWTTGTTAASSNDAATMPYTTSNYTNINNTKFTFSYQPPCSGTPTPGTPSASPSGGVCASTTSGAAGATLSLPSLPGASGYSYLWQSSPDGSTWSTASGTSTNATYLTPTTLPSTPTYYQCTVTCGGSPATSSTITVNYNSFLNCYCDYTSFTAPSAAKHIANVTLAGASVTINNNPSVPTTAPYYTVYATPVADLNISSAYTVKVTTPSTTSKNNINVYIDWNQNGVFGDNANEFIGGVTNAANGVIESFPFTVPATASTGTTAMRVDYDNSATTTGFATLSQATAITNNSAGANAPCTFTATNGETEDYRVTINAAPCSGTPTAGNVYAGSSGTTTTASVCPGSTQAMFITGQTTGVSGITYQWQSSSTSGGTYTNVSGGSGATSTNYTTPALTNATLSPITTYYKCVITCTNSSSSATQTTPVAVTVNPTPSLTINGSNTYTAAMCNTGSPNSVALAVSNAASGTTTYSWSPATNISPSSTSASVTVTPPSTTTYTVTGTANSCTATATAAITVNPSTISFNPSSSSITLGGSASITASATSTNGSVSYAWSPSTALNTTTGPTVSANPLSTTVYTVTASDPAGCSVTGSTTVSVYSGSPGTVSCGYTYTGVGGSTYTTASSLGTPTVVASGASIDNSVYTSIPIGFTFNFNDAPYSSFGISSNTFIWFGTGTCSATQFRPLSSTAGQTGNVDGIAAVYAMDNMAFGSSSAINVVTSGTAPNRVCVIEWLHFLVGKDNGSTCVGPYTYPESDFQIRLYESTNNIEFWYNSAVYDLTAAGDNEIDAGQVGIRSSVITDYQIRKVNCSNKWAASIAGSISGGYADSCMISGDGGLCAAACSTWPTTGDNFRYSPTAKPTITPTGQQNICAGSGGVTLTANTTMSSPTYQWQTYSWPPSNSNIGGQTASTYLANPSVGTYYYTVQVTSGTCVRNSDAEAVVVAAGPTLSASGTNITCNNANNGSVTFSASSGSSPYTFSLNGGTTYPYSASSSPVGSLSGGTYNVIAKDNNGCLSSTIPVTITNPAVLTSPVITATNISCHNANDGSVTVSTTPTGGTGSYQYSINGSTYQSGTTFGSLSGGNYTVTVKDANGCTNTSNTVNVSNPGALTAPVITATNISCNNANDGSVTVSTIPTGGTGSYQYSIDGVTYQSGTTFGSLSGGNYTVTVKDANGCTNTSNTVAVVNPSVITAGASNTGPYSAGQTIDLSGSGSGGTGTLSYSWSGPLSYSASGASPTIPSSTTGMTGTYTVTVTDVNGCSATASTDVTVNTSTETWNGSISTNWFTAGNWTPSGIPNACGTDVVIPSGTLHAPTVSGSPASVGNINIADGVTLTLSGQNLNVCKNITGGSSSNAVVIGSGLVVLNGSSSAQSISGYLKFNELQLANSHGASLAADANVSIGTALDLNASTGTFDASLGNLTFLSTGINQVAIIDNFSGASNGTLTGSVNAQRYYNAAGTGSYKQHYFGSPVNAPAFSQLGSSGTPGYVVPMADCDETQLSHASPYGTVFSYHESNGLVCGEAQWYVETTGNAQNGNGYSVVENGSGTLSLAGTANLNPSYTVSNLANSSWSNTTLQGRNLNSGWQLLANPYLASLQLTTSNAGFDNQLQVWHSNGAFAGSYQSEMINSGSDTIAPFQAFMVHKTSAGTGGTYMINGSERVRTAYTFFDLNDNQLDITVQNVATGLMDVTTVAFNGNATDNFDPQYDANKFGGALNRHTLYTLNHGQWMARNVLNSINSTPAVTMGLEPGVTGSYAMNFANLNTFDPTTYIYLEDKFNGTMYNVRNGSYNFTSDSSDTWERFVLHFTPPMKITTAGSTCTEPGVIYLVQPGTASWNYTLVNASNSTVASGVINETTSNLIKVPVGTYTLTLVDANGYTVTKSIEVNGIALPSAGFAAPATASAQSSINFISSSQNASNYSWSFGDGGIITGVANPTYTYGQPGVYTVTLTVTNVEGCVSTSSQTITITGSATGLANVADNGQLRMWSNENLVYVDFTKVDKVDAVIKIYNILGQEISNEKFANNSVYQKEIDNIAAAYVIVSVKNEDATTTRKLFIINPK